MQFRLARKRLLSVLLLAVLLGIYVSNFRHYDLTALYFSYAMWLASMAVVVVAVTRKARGARGAGRAAGQRSGSLFSVP
ncbi:hypothetical protein LRS06_24760 [Hymenobacter sp. J193]|uniref:hypothetical protein n=1 Tax=Hymenobacter sp. J193 TaxID=2898429 RepID=UPI0021516878|nr:hypothetical protein [Hymenobacter sp. J193]MCR5890938.1 hypothetical protein [Hymenobacter sp. J193]